MIVDLQKKNADLKIRLEAMENGAVTNGVADTSLDSEYVLEVKGRPWLNQHSSCTTNKCLHMLLYGFNPDFRQYASRVPCPCRLTVVYEISPPLNLACQDIVCTLWNQQ